MFKLRGQGRILESIIAVTIIVLTLITLRGIELSTTTTSISKGVLRESLARILLILDTYGYIDEYFKTGNPIRLKLALNRLLPNIQYELVVLDVELSRVLLKIGELVEPPFIEEFYLKKPLYYNGPVIVKIAISCRERVEYDET
ncbi:MAG TPA: hypothetical protein EYH40_04780 [Desulfurococcales archaeon]|nr:hypothetical protein [Desulfurococcales archaeon]